MDAGIGAYAAYVPYLRIKKEEYLKAWRGCSADFHEKAVADIDEDSLTMAVEAGRQVLKNMDPAGIDVLVYASANYPYSEKVMSGSVACALGLRKNVVFLEQGGSTLAGTQALLMALELLAKRERRLALVLVADNPAARPGDDIEHGLGAASCAFLLGKENVAVRVEGWTSWVKESLGTRFRGSGEPFARDLGIKTLSSDAYADTIIPAVKELTCGLGTDPGQYRHVVLGVPGARMALSLGRSLGLAPGRLETGLLFRETGDTGSCLALLGLCAVLDEVEVGDRVLLAGSGAGAGACAASLVVGGAPLRSGPSVRRWLDRKTYIDYVQYLKIRGHILGERTAR